MAPNRGSRCAREFWNLAYFQNTHAHSFACPCGRASRRDPLRIEAPIAREPPNSARACSCAETHDAQDGPLTFGIDAGHCGPSCLFGGGLGPPPVSPIYSDGIRIAGTIDNPIQRA